MTERSKSPGRSAERTLRTPLLPSVYSALTSTVVLTADDPLIAFVSACSNASRRCSVVSAEKVMTPLGKVTSPSLKVYSNVRATATEDLKPVPATSAVRVSVPADASAAYAVIGADDALTAVTTEFVRAEVERPALPATGRVTDAPPFMA